MVSPEAMSKKLVIDKPYPSNTSPTCQRLTDMEQRLAKAIADSGSFTFMHVDHATPPAISDKFLDGVQAVLCRRDDAGRSDGADRGRGGTDWVRRSN